MPNGPRQTAYTSISVPVTVREQLHDRLRASPYETWNEFALVLLASYDTLTLGSETGDVRGRVAKRYGTTSEVVEQ